MNTRIKSTAELRNCPECAQRLPSDWDWQVRSLTWMHDLPRKISPTNDDLELHDGEGRRNRFLRVEFKIDKRPLQVGQRRLLEGLSMFKDNFVVLVVRGKRVDKITVQRVEAGAWLAEVETTCEALNRAMTLWLNGALWRDAKNTLLDKAARPRVPSGRPGHAHGWADLAGVWTCVQDYYAAGEAPETACGEVWQ